MSKQEIEENNIGRDQYNISGNKTKIKVDNRTGASSSAKPVREIIIGIIVAVIAGFLIYRFGWT